MKLVRSTWFLCLALAVFIAVGGQVRAWGVSDAGESDPTPLSIADDVVASVFASPHDQPAPTSAGPPMFDLASPSDRLVVSDFFRPPRSAAL